MRILIIDDCKNCHYFDSHYYTYNEECELLKRKIKDITPKKINATFQIPEDCPLHKSNEALKLIDDIEISSDCCADSRLEKLKTFFEPIK